MTTPHIDEIVKQLWAVKEAYRFYIDASDTELLGYGITREHALKTARYMDSLLPEGLRDDGESKWAEKYFIKIKSVPKPATEETDWVASKLKYLRELFPQHQYQSVLNLFINDVLFILNNQEKRIKQLEATAKALKAIK